MAASSKKPERALFLVACVAAGLACASRLRKLGYGGSITILSADKDAPCDRPNISKDYLAGKPDHKMDNERMVEHIVELVEAKAAELAKAQEALQAAE